ncbi:GNAT family N-acetyltransferase [Streptomyces brevispora]|uniref:Amino-acid N-acetyltransferase n=1 Tax=Streptomyces brevispora TaxID=887462 RepID=A0A561V565_9ACTN|nr:amino-acid N-acetyltransferase [Streptomyces brevispora]
MITATPRPAAALTHTPHAPRPDVLGVRQARPEDAAALVALSEPFVRSGALRERPSHVYAARAADFLVAEEPDGALSGCLALRVDPEADDGTTGAGVLYNFCVARQRQGSGLGARLLGTALARARAQSLGALFTATTGSGRLFLRHGFAPVLPGLAPRAWVCTLDPRRGARVLARAL